MEVLEDYVDTEVRSDISKLKRNVNVRKFKPNFYVSTYWGEIENGSGLTYTDERVNKDLGVWKDHGVDGIVLILEVGLNTSTGKLCVAPSLDKAVEWCTLSKETYGLPVYAVKVHKQGMTSSSISGLTDFEDKWKAMLINIANTFTGLTDNIFVFNEFSQIYLDETKEQFVLDCIQSVKDLGYKVGISSQGQDEMFVLSDNIKDNLDILGINHYRYISNKKELTTYLDSYKSWNNATVFNVIRYLKNKYPQKQVIFSETGVQDYWEALAKPENFTWNDTTAQQGKVQDIYLYGLLNSNNSNYLDAVCWWFNFSSSDNITKETLRYYLKGER